MSEMKKTIEEIMTRLDHQEQGFLANASRKLVESATPLYMKKGSIFIQKGERTEAAYYILTGKMYVQSDFLDGNVYQFSTLGKGKIISDIEILSGTYINAATLVVAEDVMTLKFPLDLFVREIKTNLDFLYYVTTGMATKFYLSSYARGTNLFKEGADKVLLYLIRCYERDEEERSTVRIQKTRDIMASEIGISIKTLNRSIKKIASQDLITMDHGKVLISEMQFQKLLELANQKLLY